MKKNGFIILVISSVILFAYGSILGQKTVDPDASIILNNLDQFQTFSQYLQGLFNFSTIDVQPFRDLTLYVDLWIYRNFNFSSFVLQNVLWWIGSCFLLYQILDTVNIKKDSLITLLLILAFSVYPLFVPVVSWGMSRKHLISFFFILCATFKLLKLEKSDFTNSLKVTLFYLLAIFSQPINLLWPFWAGFYLVRTKKFSFKQAALFLSPALIIFTAGMLFNFFYYKNSSVFKAHFDNKTDHAFELADKLLAFGHYHFQLFIPYLLSFKYSLGDTSVLIGLLFFVALMLVAYKKKEVRKELITWLTMGYFCIFIVLNTPTILSDSYLLVPAAMILIIFSSLIKERQHKVVIPIISVLICFWSFLTIKDSKNWLTTRDLTKVSFQKRPNCHNALNYVRSIYEDYEVAPKDLKEYLLFNECFKNSANTTYGQQAMINIWNYFYFHEEEVPYEVRLNNLKQMSQKSLISGLTLAAFYLKYKQESLATEVINDFIYKSRNIEISGNEYHNITAKIVHPYCQQKQWKDCIDITTKLSQKIDHPYYEAQ